MSEEMISILILIGIAIILYICAGCAFTVVFYKFRNPTWKLPFTIFWPIIMIWLGLYSAVYENYILEIIDYYKEKKEWKNGS